MINCQHCKGVLTETTENDVGHVQNTVTDESSLSRCQQRIKELELELAKTKLEKVEAECRNQVCTI